MFLEKRLLEKREIKDMGYTTPCWIFTGHITNSGYGYIRDGNSIIMPHVAAARLWLKNYNNKIQTLHRCDIRVCFNPEHLFQGSQRTNMLDSLHKGRHFMASKTHCKRGHEFTEENTMNNKKGARLCRECRRLLDKKYYNPKY